MVCYKHTRWISTRSIHTKAAVRHTNIPLHEYFTLCLFTSVNTCSSIWLTIVILLQPRRMPGISDYESLFLSLFLTLEYKVQLVNNMTILFNFWSDELLLVKMTDYLLYICGDLASTMKSIHWNQKTQVPYKIQHSIYKESTHLPIFK